MAVDPRRDAMGQLLLALLEGSNDAVEIIERNDGFVSASPNGPKLYLAPFRRWPPHHRRAVRHIRGRVLDVGAGGGRVALELQARGHEVVAIDSSPGAVEVCRRRGVRDARLCAFEQIDDSLGMFDSVVMLGNNLGLFGSPTRAKRLLRRLHRMTNPGARIVAESRDVERRGEADRPWHIRYRLRNVERGRLPGQIRLRVRFRDMVGPWIDYPMVSPEELEGILRGTGWQLSTTLDSDDTYIAVISRREP
jgi:SAM-dependent methyltransferase